MAIEKKVHIKPELLKWARERRGVTVESVQKNFSKIEEWESGQSLPTLKQLEKFAKTVHVPIGYLFLETPPEEPMPIQDFRTVGSYGRSKISVNARDMIYLCQRRQDWYRDYALVNGMDKIGFIDSKNLNDESSQAAAELRSILQISIQEQISARNIPDFSRILREKAEAAGVLVMISGIVGGNTYRTLNVKEFRGFALSDAYAPLIFVNGNDSDAGKIFTLAHELAHICLGQTGISDIQSQNENEKWCNAFAAEFLVPLAEVITVFKTVTDISQLAKYFKVSSIVIAQRLHDAALISSEKYDEQWRIYEAQQNKAAKKEKEKGKGGDYFKVQPVRASRRFLRALSVSAAGGQTLYRDALRLAGVKSVKTFEELAARIRAA